MTVLGERDLREQCKKERINFLTPEDVLIIRRIVKKHVASKQSPEACRHLVQRFVRSMTGRSSCSRSSALCALDVARSAALVAILSEASSPRIICETRRRLVTLVKHLGHKSLTAARATLAQRTRAWHALNEHSRELIARLVALCKQEALKTGYSLLLTTTASAQERERRALKVNLADVRVEMLADVCSLPASASEGPGACHASSGWRGVNLGGWLLWEPGTADGSPLVASLGRGCGVPPDEWTLCQQLRAKYGPEEAAAIVQKHRNEHVTLEDFVAMKRLGLNAVRVPFGYWAFCPREGEPFFGPCTDALDAALAWGSEVGLSVVLCLHAAVGFQSTEPPCGRANDNWRPRNFDIEGTVEVLRLAAMRYGRHPALGGICILNEPHGDMPAAMLNRYFKAVYTTLRGDCGLPASVQLMMPVFQHDFKDFADTYTEKRGYIGVVFDVHCYQVFGDPYAGWCNMSLAQHLRYAAASSKRHDVRCVSERGERVVVSEFSLGLPVWHAKMSIGREYVALKPSERARLRRCFALRQLRAFAAYTEGFFFWCWKDDAGPEWSLEASACRGWVPRLADTGDSSPTLLAAAAPALPALPAPPLAVPAVPAAAAAEDETPVTPAAKRCRWQGPTTEATPPKTSPAAAAKERTETWLCSEASTDAGVSSDDGSGDSLDWEASRLALVA